MVKDSTFGLMEEDMKVNGKTITCMVVVFTLGKTVVDTKESI